MNVSVVIPIYNGEGFLTDCVESLDSQTCSDFEAIFIDDASADSTVSCLSALLENVSFPWRLLQNPTNRGTGHSRNRGIMAASATYVFFMDVDDTITKDCLEKLLAAAAQAGYPDVVMADVACQATDYRYKTGFDGGKHYTDNQSVRQSFFRHIWYEMPWNKLVRTSFLRKNRLWFAEDCMWEDTPWSFHLALTARSMVLVPGVTYRYRVAAGQKVGRTPDYPVTLERLKVFALMDRLAREDGDRNALIWLNEIATGFLMSVIRNGELTPAEKCYIYEQVRAMCDLCSAVSVLHDSDCTRGVKAMLLYRFFPKRMGLTFLHLLNKGVERWSH